MPLLSMRQYAKHRGVSPEAVSKAVRRGRITCKRQINGQALIDPEVADREWDANTDPSKGGDFSKAVAAQPPVHQEVVDNPKGPGVAEAARVLKAYQAKLAKLEYEEKSGQLVRSDEVEKKWIEVAGIVRTKIMGIPSKIRQRIPEVTADQYVVMESIVRETLEDLSDGES